MISVPCGCGENAWMGWMFWAYLFSGNGFSWWDLGWLGQFALALVGLNGFTGMQSGWFWFFFLLSPGSV